MIQHLTRDDGGEAGSEAGGQAGNEAGGQTGSELGGQAARRAGIPLAGTSQLCLALSLPFPNRRYEALQLCIYKYLF